jgi:hypothetical protein
MGRDADRSPHLVLRPRMSRSYAFSPLGAYMTVGGQFYGLVLRVNSVKGADVCSPTLFSVFFFQCK